MWHYVQGRLPRAIYDVENVENVYRVELWRLPKLWREWSMRRAWTVWR